MNAVEQLLAHADRTVALFDEMLGPYRESSDQQGEPLLLRMIAPFASGGPFAPNEAADGPPSLRSTLTGARLALMERWASEDAASAAVVRAVDEGKPKDKRHGRGADLSPLALRIYCDFLSERERLLSDKDLRAMLASIVTASLDWGPHAGEVVRLSQSLVAALNRLLHRDPLPGHDSSGRMVGYFHGGPVRTRSEWASEKRHHVQPAIEALRIYSKPPAAAATSEKKTGGKPAKRRGRPGAGGRRPKWSAAQKRQILSDREQHEKQKRRLRKPPEKVGLWRRDWATENQMTVADARLLWQAAKRDKYR